MILKFEDNIYVIGAGYGKKYINSDTICRIKIYRKRIRLYLNSSRSYVFVGNTKHNLEELQKIDKNITWL